MSNESPQEGTHGGPLPEGDASSGASEFEDSFLREMSRSEPWPELPSSGARFGGPDGRRYLILAWMGGGGMGQVFRALDETLRREVAVKFLMPRAGFEAEALREARAVARLDHENIVRIFDVGEWKGLPDTPGLPFLVMECLEGEPLSTLLKRGRLEVGRALEILDGIAAGLENAHAHGLVHRDLKPGNVFLTREGTVKLLDFGLAHLMEPSAENAPLLPMQGTPPYMAPEQWLGRAQDARTDIWAAGVVLYEMLTGAPPFAGFTLRELRRRVISQEPMPPVRARNPEVPLEVEPFLAMALAKEPARRFPSARELRRELNDLRERLARPGFEAPRPGTWQRRQLVLLSCQLTGVSGLAGRWDAEDLGELESAFHQGCEELIRQYGGGIHLAMGGEVFASFGFPRVREDDAERGAQAALHLARELPGLLQRKLPHLSLSGLGVRVGLHTDRLVLDKHAMQGEAPRVVSWLASQAGPGEVLASEAMWRLMRGAFETETLGARAFTGLAGPARMEVHRVLREREVRVRFERTLVAGGLTPLVGREQELRRLLAFWELAREGQGAFVLVRGEAGFGKSRLLEELRERVPAETALRLRFQCWSRLSASALPPVAEVLQQLLPLSPEGPPERRLEELRAQLGTVGLTGEHVHLLGLLLSLPVPRSAPAFRLTPERRQEEGYRALVDLLLRVARRRPVLATVEDLHWADSSWLEFLGSLLQRLQGARLLVVLSARPEFQPAWPSRPGFHPLTLERLPDGLSAALVKQVARGRALPAETVQHLVEKTDGIPLFIEEMTRMVLAGGRVASIPVTLHELLLARLDQLPSSQKTLARLGAVVGRDFSLELLAALTRREPIDLRRELAGLVEAGLLQEVREGPPGYEFRHALFQEAAYQSLPRVERRAHHRHIARVLEERFPAVVEARPEALAHHLTEAGEPARAIGYWALGGQLAILRHALPEAVGHLSRALALLPALPEGGQRLELELKIRSALGFSMMEVRGYGAPETERMFDSVWALLGRVGEALPRLDLFIWGLFAYFWLGSRFHRANEFVERLLDLGQRHGNPGLLSLGHRMRAILLFSWGRPREAAEEFARALEGTELLLEEQRGPSLEYWGEPRTLMLAFNALVHSVLGRVDASRRYGQEALERAARIAHPYTLNSAQVFVALACADRRDAREALALAERALEISSARGVMVWHWWATLLRASALSELGRPREGLALASGVLETWRRQGPPQGIPYSMGVIAKAHLALGQLREALAVVDEALVRCSETGEVSAEAWLRQLRSECLRCAGREEEARSSFLRAISVARGRGAGLYELRATVGLCRLLRDTGRSRVARRLLERACARFAPGGDCVDLQEARALLAGLAGGGVSPT